MLNLSSIALKDVVFFLIFGVFFVGFQLHRFLRSEQLLDEWASKEGGELLETERCFFKTGPFNWFAPGDRVVFRVKFRDRDGKVRDGWVRCGGWFFGLRSDHTEVRWD